MSNLLDDRLMLSGSQTSGLLNRWVIRLIDWTTGDVLEQRRGWNLSRKRADRDFDTAWAEMEQATW